jgi:Prp8 binding protein
LASQEKKLGPQTFQLTGHLGEIYTMKFSSDGQYLASAGHDRLIFFWDVFPREPESSPCKNIGVLKGHKNAILELQWGSENERLYTCSSDKQVFVWDTMEGFQRVRKMKGHKNVVNSIDTLRRAGQQSEMVVTGSDDFTVKLWDDRVRNFVASYELDYQITSVAFSRGAVTGSDYIYFGGLDNTIKAINLRKN